MNGQLAPAAHRRLAPPARRATTLHPRLQDEWEYLRRRPDLLAEARGWRVTRINIDDLDELLTLAGFRCPASAETERVLLRLVLLARAEPLAGRIVLQRLLPGLLARVRRRRHWIRGTTDVFEELVSAAWTVICEYDPRRRPSCLAAALISGADYVAFGRDQRRRDPVDPCDPHQLDRVVDPTPPTSPEELAALLREGRDDGMTDRDLAIVHGLVAAGSPSALAAELGVTPRTVRNRRDRATSRLRRVALAA